VVYLVKSGVVPTDFSSNKNKEALGGKDERFGLKLI
jgi:hypothetical protein